MRCRGRFAGIIGWSIVALLVFAPGPSLETTPAAQHDAGNLAARMLAPTVDHDLTTDGQVASTKGLITPREKSSKGDRWAAQPGGVALLASVLAALSLFVPLLPRYRFAALTSDRGRAPPLLQTV